MTQIADSSQRNNRRYIHTRSMRWWVKTVLPLLLGVILLLYIYRQFDFAETLELLRRGTDYRYLLLSLVVGVLGNVLRGYRWHLQLIPLYRPPGRAINPILTTVGSYAVNLAIPRAGELWRCGEMKHREQYRLSEVLGSLILDRVSDVLVLMLLLIGTFLYPYHLVQYVLEYHGIQLSIPQLFDEPSAVVWGIILGACVLLVIFLYAIRRSRLMHQIQKVGYSLLQGASTLRSWRSWWHFTLLTIVIWVCYFFHFYIAFWAFSFTAQLGSEVALVAFVLSTLMIAIPVPAGIGPWHYAVILSLTAWGVSESEAGQFALIVHTVQTLWTGLVGIFAIFVLPVINRNYKRIIRLEADSAQSKTVEIDIE